MLFWLNNSKTKGPRRYIGVFFVLFSRVNIHYVLGEEDDAIPGRDALRGRTGVQPEVRRVGVDSRVSSTLDQRPQGG